MLEYFSCMAINRRKSRFENVDVEMDYKNVSMLMNYVDSSNKIIGRRQNGLTAKKQRDLQKAVKRARSLGIMPY